MSISASTSGTTLEIIYNRCTDYEKLPKKPILLVEISLYLQFGLSILPCGLLMRFLNNPIAFPHDYDGIFFQLIDKEVLRNLELALICVMACTILLIANWQICFWIFLCVLLTMLNVCGFMQRWGLTIDLVRLSI